MSDDGTPDPPVSGRRGFFKHGLGRLREGGLDALRALGEAARGLEVEADGDEGASTGERLERDRRHALLGDEERRRAAAAVNPRRPPAARAVIRPPGAAPEQDFLRLCDGCRACVEACPEGAIAVAPEPAESSHDREGTPVLRVHRVPCALCFDVPCAAACPTGALTPLPGRHAIRIGHAVVFRDLCLNGLGEPCEICVDQCPLGEAVLHKGADGFPEIDAAACTGCGQCVARCPTWPAALHVVPS